MGLNDLVRRSPARSAFIAAIVLTAGLLTVWASASPAGSSPDEHYHLASIWCGAGMEAPGRCELVPASNTVRVPRELSATWCHPHKPDESAACMGAAPAMDSPYGEFPTSYVNGITGNYPQAYYAITGLLVTSNFTTSLFLIRLLNAAIFIALFFLILALSGSALRRALVLGWLVGVVPLGLFLIPSINPSSWAITGVGLAWAAALALAQSKSRRGQWLLGAALVACLGLAVMSRVDAAVYAVLAAAIGFALSPRARAEVRRRWQIVAIGVAAVIALGVAGVVSTAQWGFVTAPFGGLGEGGTGLLFGNLLEVPQLWSGVLGSWGLGQLDVPLPSIVPVAGTLAIGGLVLWGLASMCRAKAVALAVLLAVLVLSPVLFLQSQQTTVGVWVQPRYLLPLILVFVGVALLGSTAREPRISRLQVTVVVVLAGIAATAALHRLLRRYVTGIDFSSWNLSDSSEWWWDGVPGPMWTWIFGTLCFVALAALAAWFIAWSRPAA